MDLILFPESIRQAPVRISGERRRRITNACAQPQKFGVARTRRRRHGNIEPAAIDLRKNHAPI
ncbi:hypothetical protein [Manganibacter manganicus]|uniref:hypothetical protein n=1 Tax=Manganibacter manganicus TaxID=1873176 RepID=UPI001957A382|nr:hypothetical protein [Pseudaminobacter manganicus]